MKTNDTLFLIVHRRWFFEYADGRKTIEYREITPFWTSRLVGKAFKRVTFQAGYNAKHRITFELLQIDKGPCPYPDWDGTYYRIHIGEQVKP